MSSSLLCPLLPGPRKVSFSPQLHAWWCGIFFRCQDGSERSETERTGVLARKDSGRSRPLQLLLVLLHLLVNHLHHLVRGQVGPWPAGPSLLPWSIVQHGGPSGRFSVPVNASELWLYVQHRGFDGRFTVPLLHRSGLGPRVPVPHQDARAPEPGHGHRHSY